MSAPPSGPSGAARIVARLPLFQELNDDQLSGVVAASREIRLAKGAMLFQKGDRARGFFVIMSGQVKLAFPSLQGSEKVVEILGPGQSFGEALMFMDRPYPVFAEAVVDAVLLEIPQRPVVELLDSDPAFARAMLAGLAKRLHGLVQDVESYTTRSSAQRLIGYLLQQAADVADGAVTITLPASKAVVASRLNLTPETLSRVFHELTEHGLLEVRGREIVVPDIAALRTFEG
ncbi:MAG: Crp/Fnr family transcriptional regulator [Proteobacteria bacterium]|nr:Crp/Fnr family transcriptional regulator [Pseudomonadota bacterium]